MKITIPSRTLPGSLVLMLHTKTTTSKRKPLTAAFSNDGFDGAMVAWLPSDDVATQLVVSGGEPETRLHLTLAFLGKASELDASQAVLARDVLRSLATSLRPFTAEVSGTGIFETEDGRAVVALVDAPELTELHRRLCESLTSVNLPVSRSHGFTAHVTLASYADGEGSDRPEGQVATEMELLIDSVSLVVGDAVETFRFGAVTAGGGDNPGHDFHGNQYTGGIGGGVERATSQIGSILDRARGEAGVPGPSPVVDLTGVRPEYLGPLVNHLRKFAKAFPCAAAQLTSVKLGDAHPSYGAWDSWDTTTGKSQIEFQQGCFSQPGCFAPVLDFPDGAALMVTRSAGALMDHELGHTLDAYLGGISNNPAWGDKKLAGAVSDYARTNNAEAFAEAFARHQAGEDGLLPPELRALLDAAVKKAKACKATTASVELGDISGHPFRGNQWTGNHEPILDVNSPLPGDEKWADGNHIARGLEGAPPDNLSFDVAQRIVDGKATGDDLLSMFDKEETGLWWGDPSSDNYDPPTARIYSYGESAGEENLAKYLQDARDDGQASVEVAGSVALVLVAEKPSNWESKEIAGQGYYGETPVEPDAPLRITDIQYNPGSGWHSFHFDEPVTITAAVKPR